MGVHHNHNLVMGTHRVHTTYRTKVLSKFVQLASWLNQARGEFIYSTMKGVSWHILYGNVECAEISGDRTPFS